MDSFGHRKGREETPMNLDPQGLDILRSVRRMELKSKAAFCGGLYAEMGPIFLGNSEAVPDPHFNRISVLETDALDQSLLVECMGKMIEGVPLFLDVPYPVPDKIGKLLLRNDYQPTGESRSSMLLTQRKDTHEGADINISLVEPETVDVFLDLFLRGFDTSEAMIPLAMGLFHDLVIQNCRPENSRLYLGCFRGEPAATLYLFFEGDEGGINMVSTKEELRGKGIATVVLERVISDAQQMGIRLLSLETRWNSAPERLYRKLGFTTIARHEVFTNVPDLKYGL
jgi:predicted GNAT family acetyltransferase